MRYYETLYIVHPDYEDARLDELQKTVDERVEKHGAEIVNSYVWGKRRLAYEVEKYRYGTYMILQYSVRESFVDELNSWMELQEQILAYLTTRLDDAPVIREERNGRESSEAAQDKAAETVKETKKVEEV
jgi:small subunit ribosomal protein S6